jgi:hypothetical protein
VAVGPSQPEPSSGTDVKERAKATPEAGAESTGNDVLRAAAPAGSTEDKAGTKGGTGKPAAPVPPTATLLQPVDAESDPNAALPINFGDAQPEITPADLRRQALRSDAAAKGDNSRPTPATAAQSGNAKPATDQAPGEVPPGSDGKPAPPGSTPEMAQFKGVEPAPTPSPPQAGMSAAPYANTMQSTHEMNGNSCQTEQNLPVMAAVAVSAQSQSVERDRKVRFSSVDQISTNPTTAAEAAAALASHAAGRELPVHLDGHVARTDSPASLRQAIGETIVGLKHMDAQSLSVILRPGGDTQLSLHLKMHQGHYEALAILERGDVTALGAEWSQLQSRLAQHGIRLAPLISASGHSTGFGGGQSSSMKQGRQEASLQEVPVPVMAKSNARKSGASTVRPASGREWWA